MKKSYTFLNKPTLFILSFSFLLFQNMAWGQVCGGIAENFDNTAGSTAGFTGPFGYGSSGTNGYLVKDGVISNGVYSVTTPTYQLPATATELGYGFTLDGTQKVAQALIKIMYISTLNNEMTTFLIGQFTPAYAAGSSQATLCQSVQLSSLPGFPTGGQYRILIELIPSTGNSVAGQTITFDEFRTTGTLSQTPLPVTFIGIEAKRTNGNAVLTWKVAGEESVNHYEVERSTDGRTYTVIGSLSKTGRDVYQYLDLNTPAVAVYRVRNVDNDGKHRYSAVVRLASGKSEVLIKAFPLPVRDQKLMVQHPNAGDKAVISLNAADGRMIRTVVPAAGSMQSYMDMSGLQKGLYTLRIDMGDGNVQILKVVKQ